MRLRHVTLTLLTVAALGASPLALADPLDPDPSFGGDGTVKIDGVRTYGRSEQALATQNRRIFTAGGDTGGGSGESSLYIQAQGRKGRTIRSNGGPLELTSPHPQVRAVLIADRRVFVVGWLNGGYDWKRDVKIPPYGFAAAFRLGLRRHAHWGTDRYFSYDKLNYQGARGLERLREVDFGSVTGGAIDSQGRILVTGRVDGQTAVLRLTRDGHIDRGYGSNGLAKVSIGSGSSPRDIAVHGTTAVVVGNSTVNGHKQGFATQITGYGYRDRSFSGDGTRLIGKPRSYVSEVQPADAGRWLIGYESGKRAGVTKLGTTGDLIGSFGRHGRASIRCTRPDNPVLDALTVDRKDGALHRVALATSCKRSGDLRRLASIWRPGGQPITSLRPDATARLPWGAHTIDLTYGWRGRLTALIPNKIVRLR